MKKRAKSKRQTAREGRWRREHAGGYIPGLIVAPEPTVEHLLPVLRIIRRQITCSKCGEKRHRFLAEALICQINGVLVGK